MTVDPNTPPPPPENPATGPESRNVLYIALAVAVVLIGVIWWVSRKNEKSPVAASTTATQTAPAAPDPVLFEVNGSPVTQAEFNVAAQSLPENMRGMLSNDPANKALSDEVKKNLAEEVIRMRLLAQEAEKLKVQEQPEVAARLSMERMNILARAGLVAMLKNVGPRDPKQLYEQTKSRWEYVEADQILIGYAGSAVKPKSGKVLSKEEARTKGAAIAAKLRGGADFAATAKAESDDTEGAGRGGAMGRIGKGMSPEQIEKALFSLQPNQISDPVESPYGFHIFKLKSRGVRPFEELEPLLRDRGPAVQADVLLEDLRKGATVKFEPAFDSWIAPQPAPGQAQPPQQQQQQMQ